MAGDSRRVKKGSTGAPPWVMTFADLMSLLMCFFVLLLSFSEMDVLKFKQIAGSMAFAFGVQREVKAKEIPKGTSIVMKEFSPSAPEDPTVLQEVRQHTTDDLKRNLKVPDSSGKGALVDAAVDDIKDAYHKALAEEVESDASEIREAFREEIDDGLVDVDTEDQRIIIRIQEKGAFPSGSASLVKGFEPVLGKIGKVLEDAKGRIVIAGHTDNIPISTARFRSNWELSAARSVTVMHHLMAASNIRQHRFLLEGHADANPLVPNDSSDNRARNRRVEVIIVRGEDAQGGEITAENVELEARS